jgi:hypothetical protein
MRPDPVAVPDAKPAATNRYTVAPAARLIRLSGNGELTSAFAAVV